MEKYNKKIQYIHIIHGNVYFLLLYRTKLYQMCKCSEVQDFIRKVDYTFYQNLVEVLMPNVLRPIPSMLYETFFFYCIYDRIYYFILTIILFYKGSLTQSIRNFAKGLESWLISAMADCPEEMTQIKVL